MPLAPDDRILYILGEDPMTCPKCGARTDFEELPSGLQEHSCKDKHCGFVFFAAEPSDEDD